MAIKYIIFDLDDTLLRKNKTISDYTIETMKKAQEKGYKIVFNTSRSFQNSKDYYDVLKADYGIFNGGCQIVDKDGNNLYSKTIPSEQTQIITKYLNTVCEKISVQTPTSFLASDKEYKSQNAIWTNFENGYYGESYKILCLSMDHDFIESIANKYNLEFQNYLNRGWHRLSVKGASKWNGILHFLEIVNGTPDEIMTFGDDFGDQEMIEKAKIGVAMKNSQPVVLEHAKYVTLSNEEDGVAHFIEDSLLK